MAMSEVSMPFFLSSYASATVRKPGTAPNGMNSTRNRNGCAAWGCASASWAWAMGAFERSMDDCPRVDAVRAPGIASGRAAGGAYRVRGRAAQHDDARDNSLA